jgi:SAM-dependent methyltransferase
MRVDANNLPADSWHHFLRLRDLHQILDGTGIDPDSRVLELGAGDGVQTSALRERFAEVVPMDIAPSGDVEGLVVADAQDLPFDDDYFDVIFSSNVLEHIEDIDKGLAEMKRVLVPGGIMVHSMPTGFWKIIQVFGRPIASAVRIIRRLMPGVPVVPGRARKGAHGSFHGDVQSTRSFAKRVIGQFVPTVHGVSGNHFTELLQFRPKWWINRLERNGLVVDSNDPLFLHSPYDIFPYRFVGLRERISRVGLASVQVYWLHDPSKKPGDSN